MYTPCGGDCGGVCAVCGGGGGQKCMYVCMSGASHVCLCLSLSPCGGGMWWWRAGAEYLSLYYVSLYVCAHVFMYVCMYVSRYAYVCLCMWVGRYLRSCACMYVYVLR